METVRLRLLFNDRHILSNPLKSEGLKRSWLLLRPELEIISDLASHVSKTFHLEDAFPNGLVLSMDGFVLPPFESTHIFRDKDIIRVKRKGSTLADINRVSDEANFIENSEIMGKQPVLSGGVPLAIGFERETGGYQSENEEDEHDGAVDPLPVESISGSKTTSKKRKLSKEHTNPKRKKARSTSTEKCSLVLEGVGNDVSIEQNERLRLMGVPSKKNIHKKDKLSNVNAQSSRECTSKVAEEAHNAAKSTPREERCGLPQESGTEHVDMSHFTNGTKKFPSRSTRRKKAKRRWLRELAKSQEREEHRETGQIIRSHPPREGIQEKFTEHQQPDQNSDREDEIVPRVVRPGHIRFEPIGKGQLVQKNKDEVCSCCVRQVGMKIISTPNGGSAGLQGGKCELSVQADFKDRRVRELSKVVARLKSALRRNEFASSANDRATENWNAFKSERDEADRLRIKESELCRDLARRTQEIVRLESALSRDADARAGYQRIHELENQVAVLQRDLQRSEENGKRNEFIFQGRLGTMAHRLQLMQSDLDFVEAQQVGASNRETDMLALKVSELETTILGKDLKISILEQSISDLKKALGVSEDNFAAREREISALKNKVSYFEKNKNRLIDVAISEAIENLRDSVEYNELQDDIWSRAYASEYPRGVKRCMKFVLAKNPGYSFEEMVLDRHGPVAEAPLVDGLDKEVADQYDKAVAYSACFNNAVDRRSAVDRSDVGGSDVDGSDVDRSD